MAARYGKKAQSKVKRAMHERKEGTLRSGGSGKKVTSRKQAIAIGLSEARREGGKVPAQRGKASSGKSSSRGKSANRGKSSGRAKSGARGKTRRARKSSGRAKSSGRSR